MKKGDLVIYKDDALWYNTSQGSTIGYGIVLKDLKSGELLEIYWMDRDHPHHSDHIFEDPNKMKIYSKKSE